VDRIMDTAANAWMESLFSETPVLPLTFTGNFYGLYRLVSRLRLTSIPFFPDFFGRMLIWPALLMHLSHLPRSTFFRGDFEYYGSADEFLFILGGIYVACWKRICRGHSPIPLTPFFFWTKNDETGRGMNICYFLADIPGPRALGRGFRSQGRFHDDD